MQHRPSWGQRHQETSWSISDRDHVRQDWEENVILCWGGRAQVREQGTVSCGRRGRHPGGADGCQQGLGRGLSAGRRQLCLCLASFVGSGSPSILHEMVGLYRLADLVLDLRVSSELVGKGRLPRSTEGVGVPHLLSSPGHGAHREGARHGAGEGGQGIEHGVG